MSFRTALIVSLAVLSHSVAAQSQTEADAVKVGPPPEWTDLSAPMAVPDDASGQLFIRRQDTLIYLGDDGETLFQSQMVRILQPQALQAGNVSIVWNPAAGSPTVHALSIHRNGQVFNVLDSASFEILRREDQLETAMLDGMLTATLQVPDLRVGDDLEFTFSIPSHDPTFVQHNYGLLVVSHSPPEGRIRLGLKWNENQNPRTQFTPDLKENIVRGDNSIEMRFDNASTITAPAEAPPRYSFMRVLEYSEFETWRQLSSRFWPLFDEASQISPESPIRQEAAQIAAQHSSKRAQAQAALELVQQQVRYVYVGLNGGNLQPATAEETWARRYGDCKGKTTLLLALLKELGIPARPVLVNNNLTDDGLAQRLPNPAMFDHVLVQAELDGETLWMDGTLPAVVEGRSSPFLPYKWILPLTEAGDPLEQVPPPQLAYPTKMGIYEIDAREGFDASARQVSTYVTRGVEGLQEYMQLSTLTASQLQTSLSNALLSNGDWDTVENIQYRYDRKSAASVLTIEGTGKVDWTDERGGAYSLALPGGGFRPPAEKTRPAAQDQALAFVTEPSFTCYATTVRLPEDTKLKNWGFNSTYDATIFGRRYYRMMERRDDHTIRMVRGSWQNQSEIDAALAKKDNDRIDDFDNSKAIIDFDPYEVFPQERGLKPVAATYEIDWLSKDTPCLPEKSDR